MSKPGKNIYKRKDGRWEGRYIKKQVDAKSKYGYVFGRTYEEAEKKLNAAISDIEHILASEELFKMVAEEWIENQKPELKASSISKYKNILNSYLIPRFGDIKISDISRTDVFQYSRELLVSGGTKADGLEPKTVNSILSVAKNVFNFAKREKAMKIAPIKDISVKQTQKPMRILSIDEQQCLSRYLQENISACSVGILLCLYTGLRIGEICALRWKDICIHEKYLHVRMTMQRIQVDDLENKRTRVVIQSPKSDCSVRIIPIPDKMLQFCFLLALDKMWKSIFDRVAGKETL